MAMIQTHTSQSVCDQIVRFPFFNIQVEIAEYSTSLANGETVCFHKGYQLKLQVTRFRLVRRIYFPTKKG